MIFGIAGLLILDHVRLVLPSHRNQVIDVRRNSIDWFSCEENIDFKWIQNGKHPKQMIKYVYGSNCLKDKTR